MTYEKSMNARRFIEFLKRLLHDESRPVFLIVDGHPVHRSRTRGSWILGVLATSHIR